MSVLWRVIRQTSIPIVISLSLGVAGGIALGAREEAPSETPPAQRKPKAKSSPTPPVEREPTESPSEPRCPDAYGLLLIAVETSGEDSSDAFNLAEELESQVHVDKQDLPFNEEDIKRLESQTIKKAEELDATVFLTRLVPGNAQLTFLERLAPVAGDELYVLAGGQEASVERVEEIVEPHGGMVLPLTSIEGSGDLLSESEQAEALRWLRREIECLDQREGG